MAGLILLHWARTKLNARLKNRPAVLGMLEVALGVQRARTDFWWSMFGGVIYRHTNISPHDPESAVQGGKFRIKLQVEGEQTINPLWKLSGNASYIFEQDAIGQDLVSAVILALATS